MQIEVGKLLQVEAKFWCLQTTPTLHNSSRFQQMPVNCSLSSAAAQFNTCFQAV